jgi:addiction module RelE/StbE family toxin
MKDKINPFVSYSILFTKQLKASPLGIKIAFRQARELFLEDSAHSSLRDHSLRGEFSGYRSINITGDYRAIYRKRVEGKKEFITFYMIGTHKELYKRK